MGKKDIAAVNALRVLAADSVQKANSGHPGLPLGAAAAAFALWGHCMRHNPKDPGWANRDRFVLSGGHGSTLLYSLLHLFGYGLSLDDLKNFRQLDSLTPGHPEYGHTVGVEATTGPLGAGMGMAVGMALAETHLAARFNTPQYQIVDHYTYVLGGDGCMMEGISSEAFSLAGTLKLHKLIVLYDSNNISIEGSTDIAFTENVGMRMEAFGFQVLTVEDGNDVQALAAAVAHAHANKAKPSFIIVKTKIGWGCKAKEGSASAHGEPLGDENILQMKKDMDWPSLEPFEVPEEVYEYCHDLARRGEESECKWNEKLLAYAKEYPEQKALWDSFFEPTPKEEVFDEAYWQFEDKPQATRNLSGSYLNRLKDRIPNLIGGSADLAPSTKTYMTGAGDYAWKEYAGRNLHFGVRELAMTAIGNGIMLHGGLRAYVSTFFVFSDYVKPMARLSALMKLPLTFVLTHDSIGVGEDGPTHEPIEQLAMLRAMPNFHVFRPADATETAAAWHLAATAVSTPTALVLSRQNLPQLKGSSRQAEKGGYILQDSAKETPDAILIATGSEVALAVDAKAALAEQGVDVRVVSMPCMELFEKQTDEYKEKVLPNRIRARVAIEALSEFGWWKYAGMDGKVVAMRSFGASAPAELLFDKFGFTVENVVKAVRSVL